jgi:hypothetical protein
MVDEPNIVGVMAGQPNTFRAEQPSSLDDG